MRDAQRVENGTGQQRWVPNGCVESVPPFQVLLLNRVGSTMPP